jgi:SnoaL-like domain
MPHDSSALPGRPTQPRFSVERWAALWASPHPELAGRVVTPDVVGYWAGDARPVRGVTQYKQRIAALLELLPDLRLEVAEHARNGDVVFVAWNARGTGANGPLQLCGVDRIRLRDGLIKEHLVFYDPALLKGAVKGAPDQQEERNSGG